MTFCLLVHSFHDDLLHLQTQHDGANLENYL